MNTVREELVTLHRCDEEPNPDDEITKPYGIVAALRLVAIAGASVEAKTASAERGKG